MSNFTFKLIAIPNKSTFNNINNAKKFILSINVIGAIYDNGIYT